MNARLALITFLDDSGGGHPDHTLPTPPSGPVDPGFGVRPPVDPGYGRPGGGWSPVDPGYGRPSWSPVDPGYGQGRPPHGSTQPLPTPPPVTPDNTLPEGGAPPTISLPIVLPPDPVVDGERLFELKYSVRYGWVLVPVEDDPVAAPKKK